MPTAETKPTKAPRPIPPALAARAAELKAKGFNVWAKADGSLGWGKPKGAAPASRAVEDEDETDADDEAGDTGAGSTPRAPKKTKPADGEGAGVLASVVVGLIAAAGLGLAGVAAWKAYRARKDASTSTSEPTTDAPTLH